MSLTSGVPAHFDWIPLSIYASNGISTTLFTIPSAVLSTQLYVQACPLMTPALLCNSTVTDLNRETYLCIHTGNCRHQETVESSVWRITFHQAHLLCRTRTARRCEWLILGRTQTWTRWMISLSSMDTFYSLTSHRNADKWTLNCHSPLMKPMRGWWHGRMAFFRPISLWYQIYTPSQLHMSKPPRSSIMRLLKEWKFLWMAAQQKMMVKSLQLTPWSSQRHTSMTTKQRTAYLDTQGALYHLISVSPLGWERRNRIQWRRSVVQSWLRFSGSYNLTLPRVPILWLALTAPQLASPLQETGNAEQIRSRHN